jgi:hypothetical protein
VEIKENKRQFEEARKFVHSLGLKSQREWRAYIKSGKKPIDIPSHPENTYRNDWKGMGDWLGTGYLATREYHSFEEARKFVHSLELKSVAEWMKFCKSGKKPEHIPTNPARIYKDKGWISWGDWLGTGAIAPQNREFLPFKEAREFVHELQLKSAEEWIEYYKSGNKPADVPANPQAVYKNDWRGYGDWLGYQASFHGMTDEPKQKLTLSLNREIIEKAKSTGLNISAITEQLLTALTYEPIGNTKDDVIKAYEALFETAQMMLRRYDAKVEVGLYHNGLADNNESLTIYPIQLDASGLTISTKDVTWNPSLSEPLSNLYSPIKILENLVIAIIESSTTNKEKIKELRLALRFIKTFFDEEENKIEVK